VQPPPQPDTDSHVGPLPADAAWAPPQHGGAKPAPSGAVVPSDLTGHAQAAGWEVLRLHPATAAPLAAVTRDGGVPAAAASLPPVRLRRASAPATLTTQISAPAGARHVAAAAAAAATTTRRRRRRRRKRRAGGPLSRCRWLRVQLLPQLQRVSLGLGLYLDLCLRWPKLRRLSLSPGLSCQPPVQTGRGTVTVGWQPRGRATTTIRQGSTCLQPTCPALQPRAAVRRQLSLPPQCLPQLLPQLVLPMWLLLALLQQLLLPQLHPL